MVASAAAVGATVGLIVAGPALAVVGAAGAGYAATTQGKAGDVSRSAGNLGLATFEAGKEFNEKHQIASKTVSFCPDVHPKPEPRFVLFDPLLNLGVPYARSRRRGRHLRLTLGQRGWTRSTS